MSFSSYCLSSPLRKPLAALVVCTALALGLLAARTLVLANGRHLYLAWNLFLAWLPMVFALGLDWWLSRAPRRAWPGVGLALAWLVFFPNAPYILTDVVHLRPQMLPYFWSDLVLILAFAMIGLVLGFLSLFLLQRRVARWGGWQLGWMFVAGVGLLNGFGIYAGRFFRWNSWDVLASPGELLSDLAEWLGAMPESPRLTVLPLLFALLLLVAYLLLYSLTHLQAGAAEGPRREEAGAQSASPADSLADSQAFWRIPRARLELAEGAD